MYQIRYDNYSYKIAGVEYDNKREISGMDSHKYVNTSGMNVPAVEMSNNKKIPGVEPEPFEHSTSEEFIEEAKLYATMTSFRLNPPPEEAAVIIPKIESMTQQPTTIQIKIEEVTV